MKKMISIAISAMIMVVCSTAAQAQDNDGKKQRMSREQLAEAQARHIARDLALDDATTQKFIKTFSDCQQEVWALGPKAKDKKKKEEMTDAEVEKSIKDRFELSEKLLKIREKYYKEYSKFLTQKQIQRVYDLEKKTMKRLGQRGKMGKRGQMGKRGKFGKRGQMSKRYRRHPQQPQFS